MHLAARCPSTNKNTILHRYQVSKGMYLFGAVLLSLLLLVGLATVSAHPIIAVQNQQNDQTMIAYVASSTESQQIRLINRDGSSDRLLWQLPSPSAPVDGIGLGGLSWHPQATELAFDSGHDWQRSMNIRDIYAVSGDGQQLRRVTRPPSPDENSQFPNGTIRFTLDMLEQGDVQLYIEGMDEPYSYFSRLHDTWTFTMTLADFGENMRQYIRVWDPDSFQSACNYSEEGWVDVVPNTFSDIGTIRFDIVSDRTCPVLFSPSWTHDGSALTYIHREADPVTPENNPWQIAHSPAIGTVGTRLFDFNTVVGRGKPYRIVSGPTVETADDIFFLETGATVDQIVYTTATNAANQTSLNLGLCPETTCKIHDIEWLPDGAGVIFSRHESSFRSAAGVLYRYNFATQEYNEILRLPNEGIGNLSISPDGNTIVFERSPRVFDGVDKVRYGPRLQCPCTLWMVDVDSSNLRLLVEDGRQPAWSPLPPSGVSQSPPEPANEPTPTATIRPNPTATLGPVLTPVWLPFVNQ